MTTRRQALRETIRSLAEDYQGIGLLYNPAHGTLEDMHYQKSALDRALILKAAGYRDLAYGWYHAAVATHCYPKSKEIK
jgi:hypothetical protein